MSSELPTGNIKTDTDKVLVRICNKTKTLFLDLGQILNLCLKPLYLFV